MRFVPFLVLFGCSDALKVTPVAYAPPRISPGMATLIFFQQGGLYNLRVIDGRRFLGRTGRGEYFEAQVAPGKHRFYAYTPEGMLATDGYCEGLDAELEAGGLYIVLIRNIPPIENKVQEAGASLTDDDLLYRLPKEEVVSFRFVSARRQVGMDAAAYFSRLQKTLPDLAAGQQEFDTWLAQPHENIWKGKEQYLRPEDREKLLNAPPPCTAATSMRTLAANQAFPAAVFSKRAGKRVHFIEGSLVDIPKLAAKECGPGVSYTIEEKQSSGTATTYHTVREGAYDVTYATKNTLTFNGGDIICDAP